MWDSLTTLNWTQQDKAQTEGTQPPGWSSVPVPRDLWVSSVSPVLEGTRETLPIVGRFPPVCLASASVTQTAVTQTQVHFNVDY